MTRQWPVGTKSVPLPNIYPLPSTMTDIGSVWPPSPWSQLNDYQARGPHLSLALRKPRDHLYSPPITKATQLFGLPPQTGTTVVTTTRQAAPQASWLCLLTLLPSLPGSPGWPGTPDNPCRKNMHHCHLGATFPCNWQGEGWVGGGDTDRCLCHMFSAVSCKRTVALAQLAERGNSQL